MSTVMPGKLDDPPTGRLLIVLFRQFEANIIAALRRAGIGDVTPAHLNVLRHLDRDGLRITALARDAALTKQAVSIMVADLEQRGYLRVIPDPDDGRAKRVTYTSKGVRLMDVAVDAVRDIEAGYRRHLGEVGYGQLRAALQALIAMQGDVEQGN